VGIRLPKSRLDKKLLSQGPACYWILDGDQTFQAIVGNPAPIFRKTAQQLLGSNIREVVPAGAESAWTDRIERVCAGETLWLRQPDCSGNGQAGRDPIYSVTLFPLRSRDGAVLFAAGMAHDVTFWAMTEKQVGDLVIPILQAQETERARFARFLHDEVSQVLSGVGLRMDLLRMDLLQRLPGSTSDLDEIQASLELFIDRVRQFSCELHGLVREPSDLSLALNQLVLRAREAFPGPLRLQIDSRIQVPPRAVSGIHRIAHEALKNAIQHAGSSAIDVVLKTRRDASVLEVRDDGRGFDSADARNCRRGLGLLIMEHYAALAGLQLAIHSRAGKGTVVQALCKAPSEGEDA
jgi:signal transduction histidine kinase